MKFRKALSLLLVGGMMLASLAGCASDTSGDDQGADSSASGDVATDDSGDGMRIGLSMSSRDQWLSMLETAVLEAAGDDVEIQAFDAENDTQKQLSHVQTWESQSFDAIIINLVNTDDAEVLIEAAGEIPVVFVNRKPAEDLLVEGKVMYVGSDETYSGQLQGDFLSERFAAEGKTDVNYVMLMGTLGLQHTNARTEFAIKALEDSGLTVNEVFSDTADFDRIKALEKMQQFIGTGKEFDCVIANNDEMALGAIEAMKAAGMDLAETPVVGIDATANALIAIEEGEMACSVFQDAAGQGSGAYSTAVSLAKGEAVADAVDGKILWIPFELVTAENVADYK